MTKLKLFMMAVGLVLGLALPVKAAETANACAGAQSYFRCGTTADYITVNIFNATAYYLSITGELANWCATEQTAKWCAPTPPTLLPSQAAQNFSTTSVNCTIIPPVTVSNQTTVNCSSPPWAGSSAARATAAPTGAIPPGTTAVLTYVAGPAVVSNEANSTLNFNDGQISFYLLNGQGQQVVAGVNLALTSNQPEKTTTDTATACLSSGNQPMGVPYFLMVYAAGETCGSGAQDYGLSISSTTGQTGNLIVILRAAEGSFPAFNLIFGDNLPLTASSNGQLTVPIGNAGNTNSANTLYNNIPAVQSYDGRASR